MTCGDPQLSGVKPSEVEKGCAEQAERKGRDYGMNVLIMLNDLRKGNGMASVMMAYYDGLLREGIQADFLLLRRTGDDREREVQSRGSRLYVLPASPVKYSPAGSAFLRRLFSKRPYDIVHVNMPGPYGAWVLKAAKKAGVRRRIYHCHNPRELYSLKARLSSSVFNRILVWRATELMACSRSAGESVFGKKPFTLLVNCIDVSRFAFSEESRRIIRDRHGIADDVLVVGAVGRLEDQKNPLFALDCFEAIARRRKAFFLWVGDGSLRAKMEEEIARRGLLSRALLAGSRADVEKYYSAFDLFLLPSRYEGLGISFLEAQASGLPVFGSLEVPEEAAATPLMKRLPLQSGPEAWAGAVLDGGGPRRRDIPQDFREKFDSGLLKDRLAEYYLQGPQGLPRRHTD